MAIELSDLDFRFLETAPQLARFVLGVPRRFLAFDELLLVLLGHLPQKLVLVVLLIYRLLLHLYHQVVVQL